MAGQDRLQTQPLDDGHVGNPLSGGCSGILIDPRVVLTAGHCVFMHESSNGTDVFDWIDAVVVTSGTHQGDVPWGSANDVLWYSLSFRFEAEDLDDVGAINLDWSVGMLTGWAGWQVGVNCDYVDDHAFADYSFPAANCGGGLHNGHDM